MMPFLGMLFAVFGGLAFGYAVAGIPWLRRPRDLLLGSAIAATSVALLLYANSLMGTGPFGPALRQPPVWLPFVQAFFVYSLAGPEMLLRSDRGAKARSNDTVSTVSARPSMFGDIAMLLPAIIVLAFLLTDSAKGALQEIGIIVSGISIAAVVGTVAAVIWRRIKNGSGT